MSKEMPRTAREETARQIDDGLILGAVIGAKGFAPAAQGLQGVTPLERPMTVDSRFDLASAAKTFTAAAAALLHAEGKLDIDAPFTEYLPEHVLGKDCDITVRDLAMHVGGFDNSKPYENPDGEVFRRELFAKKPVWPRLDRFEYACSNFILLGMIVERLSGKRLDAFCRERIWDPLGMTGTSWDPQEDDGHVVETFVPRRPVGQHSDTTCLYCPFPIGNGSAFAPAGDMLLFLRELLERTLFPAAFYDLLFTCAYEKDGARRSFGWDMKREGRAPGLSDAAIYHSGWTGQTIVVDPVTDFYAVVLTSRLGDWQEAYDGRMEIIGRILADRQPLGTTVEER